MNDGGRGGGKDRANLNVAVAGCPVKGCPSREEPRFIVLRAEHVGVLDVVPAIFGVWFKTSGVQ